MLCPFSHSLLLCLKRTNPFRAVCCSFSHALRLYAIVFELFAAPFQFLQPPLRFLKCSSLVQAVRCSLASGLALFEHFAGFGQKLWGSARCSFSKAVAVFNAAVPKSIKQAHNTHSCLLASHFHNWFQRSSTPAGQVVQLLATRARKLLDTV